MATGLQKLKVFDQNDLPKVQVPGEGLVAESEPDWYWRPIIIMTAALIFCTALFSGYQRFIGWLDQPISEVRVLGDTKYLNKTEVATKLAAGINAPLIHLDISQLRERLLEEPWVHAAQIRREWPPAIEVVIDEQIPVARWGDKGLLNHQGDIFWPEKEGIYSDLPVLKGPATETQYLMEQYHNLSVLFQEADIRMVGLTMEARGAWTLELNNGIEVIVGREHLRDRLKRFLQIYDQQLAARAADIERVDIRYTNGAAVKWRTQDDKAKAG